MSSSSSPSILPRKRPAEDHYDAIGVPTITSTPAKFHRSMANGGEIRRGHGRKPKTDAETILELEVEASSWRLERLKLLAEIKDLKDKKEGRFGNFAELKLKLQEAISDSIETKSRLESIETKLEARTAECDGLRADLDHAAMASEARELEFAEQLKHAVSTVEVQLFDAVNECKKSREERDGAAVQVEQFRDRASEHEQEITALHQALSETTDARNQLQHAVDALSADMAIAEQAVQASSEEAALWKEKHDAVLARLEDSQHASTLRASELQLHEESEEALREQLVGLSTQISDLRATLEEYEARAMDDELSRSQNLERIRNLEIQNRALAADLDQHKMALDGMKNTQAEPLAKARLLISQLDTELQATTALLNTEHDQVIRLLDQLQELKGGIRVIARIRPAPGKQEVVHNSYTKVYFKSQGLARPPNEPPFYRFDRVFGPSSSNDEVFAETEYLVLGAVRGGRRCIFAYGQTGSGKTYTMNSTTGIISQALERVMALTSETPTHRYHVYGECVEIYNDDIIDLLAPKPRQIRHHGGSKSDAGKDKVGVRLNNDTGKLELFGSRTVDIPSAKEGREIVEHLCNQRHVAATNLNAHSSRSHFVFILHVDREDIESQRVVSRGVLNLIDLAGSERVNKSMVTGQRFVEASNINLSLSCLGNVIEALQKKKEGGHIPFRNSQLTRLLEASLSGDSQTLMLCNIAPEIEHASETKSTLRFATKAMSAKFDR